VLEIVRARVDADFRARVARRLAGWETAHQARSKAVATAAALPGVTGAISPVFLCAALARELGPDDVMINEAIRNTFAVLNQIPRTRPHSYLGLAGSGLGFSGGAALGMKLARPAGPGALRDLAGARGRVGRSRTAGLCRASLSPLSRMWKF